MEKKNFYLRRSRPLKYSCLHLDWDIFTQREGCLLFIQGLGVMLKQIIWECYFFSLITSSNVAAWLWYPLPVAPPCGTLPWSADRGWLVMPCSSPPFLTLMGNLHLLGDEGALWLWWALVHALEKPHICKLHSLWAAAATATPTPTAAAAAFGPLRKFKAVSLTLWSP